jgi:Family of unknown function (DUF6011)
MDAVDINNLPPLTDEESAAIDILFSESVVSEQRKLEAEFRAQGRVVVWIDQAPTYMDASSWDWYAIESPTLPCKRIIRFILKGGGQIRVQEKFCEQDLGPGISPFFGHDFHYGIRLAIKAETPNGLVQTAGFIERIPLEMSMGGIVLPARQQDIAERAADTLRTIGHPTGLPDKENFMALLDGASGCAFCGRALRDTISKLVGYGPDCAERNGLPHNKAAADTILAKRRALGLLN